MTWDIVPAIRSARQTSCVDESSCSLERLFVCGFNQSHAAAERVAFLKCMDTQSEGDAPAIAKPCCAPTEEKDWQATSVCLIFIFIRLYD